MKTLDWIDVGPVSAERDKNLKYYFYDAGVSEEIISDPTRYLILGRKGAGKTAVFMHLRDKPSGLFHETDVVVPLSTDDFVWRGHQALADPNKGSGAQYRDSWRLVMAIEAVRGLTVRFAELDAKPPRSLQSAHKVLTRLFGLPIPTIGEVLKAKIFALSKLKLPAFGLDVDDQEVKIEAGEVSFATVEADTSLKATLSQNIEHLVTYLESALISSINGCRVFLIFDRVDEEWVPNSHEITKQLIGGLLHAAEYITGKSDAKIRPIVFLREDIFESLDTINDKNKLRFDCSRTLMWDKDRIEQLLLKRVNFYGQQVGAMRFDNLDSLFTNEALSDSDKTPLDYVYFRTFCRPRDAIAYIDSIITEGKADVRDGAIAEDADGRLLSTLVKGAEGAYSDYLYNELDDEWSTQKPAIRTWLSVLSNLDGRAFTFEQFQLEFRSIARTAGHRETIRDVLKFLFGISVIGYSRNPTGKTYFNCFNQSRKFEDAPKFYVHKGLLMNLGIPDEN